MRIIIGIMGGGEANASTLETAYQLGQLVAAEGWVLLNGGRDAGVMAASARGARDAGGLTVGILPDDHLHGVAEAIDIPIQTGMGEARNVINVLSSRVVVALAGGAGTISEVAHALKCDRPVVLLGLDVGPLFAKHRESGQLVTATSPADAIEHVRRLLAGRSDS